MLKYVCLIFWIAFSGLAVVSAAPIGIEEAASHSGESVTVRGTVVQVGRIGSGMVFFNFGARHPNATFTALVRADTPGFEDTSQFEGKEVEVTGTVELFKDKPQIVLKSPEDIRLAGDAGSDVSSAATAATPAPVVPIQPKPTPVKSPTPADASSDDDDKPLSTDKSGTTFQVPLNPAEIKLAGRSPGGVAPTEATVSIQLPPGFDPSKPQKVLVVFATDDGGGGHVRALPRFASVANAEGWVALAANGPVLENNLSPGWHGAMILAGLRALSEKYPGFKTWDFYCGGNSGGAARSSMMAGALLANGFEVKGCFMGSYNGERFSVGQIAFKPSKTKLKKVAVFFAHGTQDHMVTQAMSDTGARQIGGFGIRNIKRDTYEGGHGMDQESLRRALIWFASGAK